MISMAGGMPNVDTFPFKSASMELRYKYLIFSDHNYIYLDFDPTLYDACLHAVYM